MRATSIGAVLAATALGLWACSGGGGNGSGPSGAGGSGKAGAPAGEATAAQGSASDTVPAPSSPTRVALPGLFSIMAGLEADMARVSRGLWLEDFDTVAAGADGVANHPRVPPEEFDRIRGVLGEEMSRFGGMDRTVHDRAVELRDAAERGDLEAGLSADARLRRGCVACHSAYRERLREAIR